MMSPTFNHLLCFHSVDCTKKVSELINRSVVSLLGTRVSGTNTQMVSQGIYLKLLTSGNQKRFLGDHWDLSAHGSGEKRLPETSSSGLITTVRPDLTQSPHGFVKEDTLGGILFLRLKVSHLRPKHRLFNRSHYVLLTARA